MLAAVLSLACRHAIRGNVPLFGITATTRASGKGLLVDAIALIGTGRRVPKWTQTRDEEEERKQFLALALSGAPVCCIDNCQHPLGSVPFDQVLTAGVTGGRLLGGLASTEVPVTAVFFATGNNLQYTSDMTRRVVPIRLDPQMERPEERDGFLHPELLDWLAPERPRLLIAALTVLQAYSAAGRPPQGLTPYGSFEAWSATVRSALVWAGEPDPTHGRAALEGEADAQYETLAHLLTAWHACYGTTAMTLNTVVQDIGLRAVQATAHGQPTTAWHDLQEALGALDRRYDGKRLDTRVISEGFKRFTGRIVDGKRLKNHGKAKAGKTAWGVEEREGLAGRTG